MEKAKFHSLTLIALTISSITMALYAYQNFTAEETSYGIVFIFLSILLMAMVVYGFVRNRKIGDQREQED